MNRITAVHLPTTTEENQSGDQTSDPHAVLPDSEKMDRPTGQESDRSTPQIQIHHQTDVRHAALPSQLPPSTLYQWRALLDPKLPPADFDSVLLGVLQSPKEIEGIKMATAEDVQRVIDVLGEVGALFVSASTVLHLLKSRPPALGD